MMRRRELGAALTEALRAKAGELTVSVPPFDPHRTPREMAAPEEGRDGTGEGPAPSPLAPRRPRHGQDRRWLVLAAATVVVVAAAAGAAVRLGDGDTRHRTSTGSSTTTAPVGDDEPPAPDGALLPDWVPDGLELWDVEWRTWQHSGPPGETHQLFGDPGRGPAMLVDLLPADPYPNWTAGGTPVTVRGTTGTVTPEAQLPDQDLVFLWVENGAAISASTRGMSTTEAVAALDALTWRSTSFEDGFEAPAGGSLPLRGQATPGAAGTSPVAELAYGPASAAGPEAAGVATLEITTTGALSLAPSAADTGDGGEAAMSEDHLRDWYFGRRNDDGTAQVFDAAQGSLRLSWSDGRSVHVASPTPVPEEATLERVARSAGSRPAGELHRLRSEADANIAARPVKAALETSRGALQVHGDDTLLLRLCFAATADLDAAPDCGVRGSFLESVGGIETVTVVSTLVGNVWYVGVASATVEPVVAEAPTPGGPEPQHLTGVTGSDGRWRFLLVEVPAGVDRVTVHPSPLLNVERPR